MTKPGISGTALEGLPLRRFRSVLKDYNKVTTTYDGKERQSVIFDFIDVEPIESVVPYSFPIAQIRVGYSNRINTAWIVLSKSLFFLPRDVNNGPDFDCMLGMRQEWFMGPAKLRLADDEGNWAVRDGECWQVAWVEGFQEGNGTGPSLQDAIHDLANGKTSQEFLQAFYGNQDLRKLTGYLDAVNMATEGTLLETYEKVGSLSRDEKGVWVKTGAS